MVGAGAVLAASAIDNVTAITDTPATTEYVTTWAMFAIGALLLLAGAVATHTRFGDEYGRLGTTGTAISGLGFLSMAVGGAWSAIYTGPVVEASTSGAFAFMGLLIAVFGSLILVISLRRASVTTRAAALLIATPIVLVAPGSSLAKRLPLSSVMTCSGFCSLSRSVLGGSLSVTRSAPTPSQHSKR